MHRPPALSLAAFARNLVRLRGRAGLTQETAAERAGVSARYYQALESGTKCPSLAVVLALRAALDCRFDELLGGLTG